MNQELVSFRLSPQQDLAITAGARPVVCAVLLSGAVDPGDLRSALDRLVARHEILRTTFIRPAGVTVPQQVVHDALPVEFSSLEPAADPAAALADDLAAAVARPFALEEGPLVRASVRRVGADRHLLVLSACAACADGHSLVLLLRELAAADAEEPLQYADYAEWRHSLLTDEDDHEDREPGRAFWGAGESWPAVRLLFPGERAAPARVPIGLDAEAVAGVRRAAAEHQVGEAVFLEACWHALVARLSGEDDLTLARTEHGRWQPDLEDAVGPYAQLVPVSTRAGGSSLADLIDQLSRSRDDAARLQDFGSAGELSEFATADRIGFSFADVRLPGSTIVALTQSPLPLALELAVRDDGTDLAAELVADRTATDDAGLELIAAGFATLVASAAAGEPGAIITPQQRAELLAAASGPAPAEPAVPVHLRFAEHARRDGAAVAVRAGAETLTYAELDRAADGVAGRLAELGAGPGRTVGLCMSRTPEMIAALLGILKTGAAYVPLNLEHPPARLEHQLAESAAVALVTDSGLRGRPPGDAGAPPVAGDEDLAYVMYTSGSTGLPKGVAVTHRALSIYTQGMSERLTSGADAPLTFAAVSAISTDLGNTSVFPALTTGGCLHLVDAGAAMDPDALAALADDDPYDVLKITPSHLHSLLGEADPARRLLPRRWLILGGEALPWSLVERVHELAPDLRVLNHYGPTEATVGCCAYAVDWSARPADAATVPIGHPLAGDQVHVLDHGLEPVPAGVPGELCIGGAGLAQGYVGRPEETAERFVTGSDGGRLYRTGDRVRRLRDGAIEFLGRLDDQVKIRGHRIEPGEVEGVLLRQPGVRQAAVMARAADEGAPRLVAYLVAAGAATDDALRAALEQVLPEHMIPSAFVRLDALPFTASGKVDRRALPEPEAAESGTAFVAPRDALEEEIAGIWSELLKVDKVGVEDDFFALGGHSLLATQVIMAIRRRYGDIPLRALLAAPTVAALADAIRRS